ncbi:MAG: hypothetical protein HUU41_11175 [Bryobacteraceae bacterium]|nr:hypothetical protein [Bryobacterales bacterium]NUN01666.1 hypothetical protein [Bryobacteraceae bacterium]
MEFRSQKTTIGLMLLALPAFGLEFPAKHDHLWKYCAGTLRVSGDAVSFKSPDHGWEWRYDEIQQAKLEPGALVVLTYKDRKWRAGLDWQVKLEGDFVAAQTLLEENLGRRFVAALAGVVDTPLWKIPVKHLTRFGGSHGVLEVGESRVLYRTDAKGESRTWTLADIENISSSGPYQLTLTTFERAGSHYGNRKDFNFQLKQPLEEERYDTLWRRLHQHKGIRLLETE